MAFNIPAAEPSPEELAKECSGAADSAVEWVRSMSGIDLDFTPPSLIALDRLLAGLVPTLGRDDIEPAVVLLGSYLGEVILRAGGGRWETGDVFTGPGLRGISGKEITISPFSLIRQAFTALEDHHVCKYWNIVVKRTEEAELIDDPVGFREPPEEELKMLPGADAADQKTSEGPTDHELAEIIPEETKKFVEILKSDIGIELDYTIDSLRFLDHYLQSLSKKLQKDGEMGERRVFVYLAGNYLGEVLRRTFGGKWVYVAKHQTTGLVLQGKEERRTIYPHKAAAKLAMEYQKGGVIAYADKIKRGLKVLQK
jgi:hypothetical protein